MIEMKNRLLKMLTGLLFLTFCFSGSIFASTGPTDQLRPVLNDLTAILANPELKGDQNKVERRTRIMDSIKVGFDFREMSKRILGRSWNNISDAEKDHFTELMTKLLENVYIGKLEGYSGQTVGYVDERIKGERAQVSTLIENNGMEIPVHYIMTFTGEKWMVYDINIEGVSLVRNYKEQFKSILRTEKFEGLIKVLEQKNASFESQKG
jgi:phospholipid transport system substrate-binding protein